MQKQKVTLQKQAMSVKTRQKEMCMAMLELCLCNFLIPVHFPSLTIPCLDDAEQIETDIASARETLADASTGVNKLHGELKSLVDKVAKGEARYLPPILATAGPTLLTVHIHIHRRSTVRRSAAYRKSGQR